MNAMSDRRIALIPGDGIGPEITEATLDILSAAGFEAEWDILEAGQVSLDKGDEAMPAATIARIAEIFAPWPIPVDTSGFRDRLEEIEET